MIGTIFRSMRKGHVLTLKQVAERTGYSISFLSDLESGRAQPSINTLHALAKCYGVAISVFVDTADAPTQTPVPSFHVSHFVMFSCVTCGVTVEIKRYGDTHMASSDHCPQCHAYYVMNWDNPIEQSTLLLVHSAKQASTPESEVGNG